MAKFMGMNGVYLANITRRSRITNAPRLVFNAGWMADMGFVSRALVQYLPEKDGLSFTLCNDNIHKYSDLFHAVKEKGGDLLQVYPFRGTLQLCIEGETLENNGLKYGDSLIARYEYGLIRFRKLPGKAVLTLPPGIAGAWVEESGFLPGAVFTLAAEPGLIICTLQENDPAKIRERTAELVKFARINKLQLLQVQTSNYLTRVGRKQSHVNFFDIPQSFLEKAGFSPDEMLITFYKPGLIQFQKPDFAVLGF